MTDAERKQFINEYCRNVGNIKIKCDDCKFVDDCVDYGWEGCKKFTQKQPYTNEEWLKMMTTEQLAEFISKIDMPFMDKAPFPCGDLIECNKNCGLYSRCVKDDFPTNKEVWVEWLKQPHTTTKE